MNEFERQLEQMRVRYIAYLPEKFLDIEDQWNALIKEPASKDARDALYLSVHTLAGSAPTFSQAEVGRLSREIADTLHETSDEALESRTGRAKLSNLLDALRQAIYMAASAQPSPVQAPPAQSPEANENQAVPAPTASPAAPPPPSTPQTRTKQLVLVVDDDDNICRTVGSFLAMEDFEVRLAANGTQAYSLALQEVPDIIITDYNMPEGPGNYLLGRLKTTDKTKNIPVIVLTGEGGYQNHGLERQMMGQFGAAAFLKKPINFKEILSTVQRLLHRPARSAG